MCAFKKSDYALNEEHGQQVKDERGSHILKIFVLFDINFKSRNYILNICCCFQEIRKISCMFFTLWKESEESKYSSFKYQPVRHYCI